MELETTFVHGVREGAEDVLDELEVVLLEERLEDFLWAGENLVDEVRSWQRRFVKKRNMKESKKTGKRGTGKGGDGAWEFRFQKKGLVIQKLKLRKSTAGKRSN